MSFVKWFERDDIASMRFSLEGTAMMIVQRWRRSLKTSVIKL